MKENNELVDLYPALCYTAGSAVHAWEFVYDLSAVISTVSHLFPVNSSSGV
jgi:hypothetical protein